MESAIYEAQWNNKLPFKIFKYELKWVTNNKTDNIVMPSFCIVNCF